MAVTDKNLGQFASALPPETKIENKNGQWKVSGFHQGSPRESSGGSFLSALQGWWGGLEHVVTGGEPTTTAVNSPDKNMVGRPSTEQPVAPEPQASKPVK